MARKTENDAESKIARVADYQVLLVPVITEKTAALGGAGQTVAFKVADAATKEEIRSAVERIFSVEVDSVRTINYLGKPKKSARSRGRRAAFKKAYVSLKEGQRIDIVEGL